MIERRENIERDVFIHMLKTMIVAWKAKQTELGPHHEKEYYRLKILIEKTTIFLRDEFNEKM